MENKHTPGPWKAVKIKAGFLIKNKAGCVLARIDGFPTGAAMAGDTGPNARLMAAAPALLAALKHARDQIQHPDQMIDLAIAKAEGGFDA